MKEPRSSAKKVVNESINPPKPSQKGLRERVVTVAHRVNSSGLILATQLNHISALVCLDDRPELDGVDRCEINLLESADLLRNTLHENLMLIRNYHAPSDGDDASDGDFEYQPKLTVLADIGARVGSSNDIVTYTFQCLNSIESGIFVGEDIAENSIVASNTGFMSHLADLVERCAMLADSMEALAYRIEANV